ncbi:MAG: HAMP domain-containing protein, partial [Rhizobiales bacterium]|nr:HAMP domain-containing protein [Rhizobacter sp.]
MTLNNLRIGPRLAIGFGAVLSLLVAIVAIASYQFARTADGLQALSSFDERATIARDWAAKTQLNVARVVAIAKASGQPDIDAFFTPQIARTSTEIARLQKSLEVLIVGDAGKALMATVAARRSHYVAQREALFALIKQADAPAAEALLAAQVLPASEAYLAAMQAVQQHQADLARSESAQLQRSVGQAGNAMLVLLIVSAAVGIAMSFFISRSIVVPLRRGVDAATVIASGDLSQAIASSHRDELGDLLRAIGKMQASLQGVVGQVRRSTDSIGTASAEIATGNQDLSARTEQ